MRMAEGQLLLWPFSRSVAVLEPSWRVSSSAGAAAARQAKAVRAARNFIAID